MFSAFRSFTCLLLFLECSSHHLLAHGKTVSRLIDDTYGDRETGLMPAYYPQIGNVWQGNDCTLANGGCLIVPEKSRAQNGTWMAATYRTSMDNMGMILRFEGTAISVYFILVNDISVKDATTRTECTFTLDGDSKKQFSHPPSTQLGMEYNVEVYNATGLENKMHTLEISTGKLDHEVYINFDYAIYTAELPDNQIVGNDKSDNNDSNGNSNSNAENSTNSNNPKSTPVGAIVGGVIGGIAALCLVAVAAFLLRKRQHAKTQGIRSGHFQEPEIFSDTHDNDHMQNLIAPYPVSTSTPFSRKHALSFTSSDASHTQTTDMTEAGRLLNEVQVMRDQLHNLRAREQTSVAVSDDDLSDLHEQIRQLQLQLDGMQTLPPSYY